MNKSVNLYATAGMWLYKEQNGNREFHLSLTCPANDEQNWHECTDAEKLEWEEAHKPADIPEPPQVEEAQAEDVTDEY